MLSDSVRVVAVSASVTGMHEPGGSPYCQFLIYIDFPSRFLFGTVRLISVQFFNPTFISSNRGVMFLGHVVRYNTRFPYVIFARSSASAACSWLIPPVLVSRSHGRGRTMPFTDCTLCLLECGTVFVKRIPGLLLSKIASYHFFPWPMVLTPLICFVTPPRVRAVLSIFSRAESPGATCFPIRSSNSTQFCFAVTSFCPPHIFPVPGRLSVLFPRLIDLLC